MPEIGTTISTPAKKAGVECPKKNGKMDPKDSCQNCDYWAQCMRAIMGAI